MNTLFATGLVFGLGLATPTLPAHADEPKSFCANPAHAPSDDPRLYADQQAAFGTLPYRADDPACIRPLAALRYGDADVLLTTTGAIGTAGHANGAHLSAYVLKREFGDLKLVRSFIDFIEVGSSGEAGDIVPLRLGGDDGFVIESTYAGMGEIHSWLNVFIFNGGLVHLQALPDSLSNGSIPLATDNTNETKLGENIVVTSSWHVDTAGHIEVDYRTTVAGRQSTAQAVWEVEHDHLVLNMGAPPHELLAAFGVELPPPPPPPPAKPTEFTISSRLGHPNAAFGIGIHGYPYGGALICEHGVGQLILLDFANVLPTVLRDAKAWPVRFNTPDGVLNGTVTYKLGELTFVIPGLDADSFSGRGLDLVSDEAWSFHLGNPDAGKILAPVFADCVD